MKIPPLVLRWLGLDPATLQNRPPQTGFQMVVLYTIEAILVLFTGSATLLYMQRGENAALFAGASLVLTLGWVAMTRLGLVTLVSWLVPLSAILMSSLIIAQFNGLFDVVVFIYPALITLSGLLLGRKGVILFTLGSIVAVTTIGGLQMLGLVGAHGAMSSQLEVTPVRIIVTCMMLGLNGILLYLVMNRLANNLAKVQASENALTASNQELMQVQKTLEEQVAERTRKAEQARAEAEYARRQVEAQAWLSAGQAQLGDRMRGEQSMGTLANNVLQFICHHLSIETGALYLKERDGFALTSGYAIPPEGEHNLPTSFLSGEGIVGQAALDQEIKQLSGQALGMPQPALLAITSSLGSATPKEIVILPLVYNRGYASSGMKTNADGEQVAITQGVLVLGRLQAFEPRHLDFLRSVTENIAIAFSTAQTRTRVNQLVASQRSLR